MSDLTFTEKEKLANKLSSPVRWGETYLKNREGSPRKYWPHQIEDLECRERNIIHLDGRDTGKTVSLSTLALHYVFTRFGGSVLVAAPQQGHLDSIIEEIETQIERSPDLKASVALTTQGKPKIIRKPYFRIELTNGSIIYFRPAGAYGDAFRSLHVEMILYVELFIMLSYPFIGL